MEEASGSDLCYTDDGFEDLPEPIGLGSPQFLRSNQENQPNLMYQIFREYFPF